MAQTFASIQKQIARLEAQAARVKALEVKDVIARIRDAISHYGLSAQDLGLAGSKLRASAKKSSAGRRSSRPVKYADDKGNTWVGMGKQPEWFRDAIAAGLTKEELLVASARKNGATKTAAPKARAKTQRAGFRDDQGNTWGGRGPRPAWLKAALAAGKSLDELRA